MQFAYIHDSAMHYVWRDAGRDKPVVIFINSLGTDMRIWHDVQAQLGDAFSTLTYDKRGHGLSDTGTTPYSIEALSADLIGLMEHLAIGKAIICGLSVGGLIAQGLYAQRPDLVAGLVLSNTAHKIGNAQMWNDRIRAIEENGLASILNSTIPRWFTAQFRSPENAAFAGYCNMFIRQSQQGYTATCAALRDADFTAAASETVVPTLCIVGDQDGATPPDLVRELAQLIPGAHFRQITDSGHIPCVEQPAIFANLLREFIQTIEYGGQADG
ncbi:3-oxoadipate enol-lactonase [Ochrobactrum sp. S46]|nr:3-oxoadipate enol-lactonase [Ochrobactrum sp. S45]MBK0046116.1 3-oxoadipate enol-lactonase [Ochrobactrum sp. S46]